MARIAVVEDVDGIRAQQDVDGTPSEQTTSGDLPETEENSCRKKLVATAKEVIDAFDSVNTLRFSQPAHLQGLYIFHTSSYCAPK